MSFASKSPWVIHYDGSSCNGCDIEVLAALTPGYDVERFGIINTGNPKHADIFLVTGSVNEQNIEVVQEIYNQMVEPKVVIACGVCACSAGIFHDCYNIIGGVDKAIPVDVYAPGCAVRPEAIIDAVVQGIGILDKKRKLMEEGKLDPSKSVVEKQLHRKDGHTSDDYTPEIKRRVLVEYIKAHPEIKQDPEEVAEATGENNDTKEVEGA